MFSQSGITVGAEAEIKTADEAVSAPPATSALAGARATVTLFSVSFTAQETKLENDQRASAGT
jgi:hypothetical protein